MSLNIQEKDPVTGELKRKVVAGNGGGTGLPEPESKDKLLLSTENEETSELEWKQVDKSTVGNMPFIGTHDEWDALTDEQKAQYETVIFTDDTSSGLIDDNKISSNSTWSSEKINDSLVDINVNLGELSDALDDKQDYKSVVEDTRYVEDVVLQEINNWLPNDNSSILVNLKKKNGAKYSSYQLICNKTDSQNWECIVNGAGILWKINYVNGVRTIQELATMDKVPSSKNRISEQIVTMDNLDDTKTGLSIDFDANSGQIRLYVMKNGVSQKIVTFKSV